MTETVIISEVYKDKFNLLVLLLESSANKVGSLQGKDEYSRGEERQMLREGKKEKGHERKKEKKKARGDKRERKRG